MHLSAIEHISLSKTLLFSFRLKPPPHNEKYIHREHGGLFVFYIIWASVVAEYITPYICTQTEAHLWTVKLFICRWKKMSPVVCVSYVHRALTLEALFQSSPSLKSSEVKCMNVWLNCSSHLDIICPKWEFCIG